MKWTKYFFLIVLFGLLSSCQEDTFYSNQFVLNGQQWAQEEVMEFPFEIGDNSMAYDLLLDIECLKDYAHQNIYVKIYTQYPSGKVVEDIVSLDLMDKFGNWNGDCNSTACDIHLVLQQKTKFPEVGNYKISVEQFMRVNPLKGLESITFKIVHSL